MLYITTNFVWIYSWAILKSGNPILISFFFLMENTIYDYGYLNIIGLDLSQSVEIKILLVF